MRCESLAHASEQAQANANSSGVAWVVIRDTNGVYNAESSKVTNLQSEIVIKVCWPELRK